MNDRHLNDLAKLESNIDNLDLSSPLEKMKAELSVVASALEALRHDTLTNGFADTCQETYFFKKIKPRFTALSVLSAERYRFEVDLPVGDGTKLKEYYRRTLDHIDRLFNRHQFFHQYYLLDAKELDELFFVRGAKIPEALAAGLPEIDPSFSTTGEYLFSQFIAMEKLRKFVLSEMESQEPHRSQPIRSKKGRDLRWTGETCNLIEVAYGIFDTGQINHGQLDLSDLMDVLSQCFQVDISRYFRRFTEIKRRKSMSKTRFLDEMARAIHDRIDKSDAYVPFSMK